MPSRRTVALVWAVGSRLPHWAREAIARAGGWLLGWRSPLQVPQWEANVEALTGRRPTRRQRQELLTNWARNNLMSLSLGGWSDADVLKRGIITPTDHAKVDSSLAGPGLIMALPHMGSWDFAGAWCARVGVKIVSVAERLPAGLYERFAEARSQMGMDIYPMGSPGIIHTLAEHVKRRHAVCLLSDRALGGKGVPADFAGIPVTMPSGAATLALKTGADLRAVVTRFHGDRVEMLVSDPIAHTDAETMTQELADYFADGARRYPTSWLLLRKLR